MRIRGLILQASVFLRQPDDEQPRDPKHHRNDNTARGAKLLEKRILHAASISEDEDDDRAGDPCRFASID